MSKQDKEILMYIAGIILLVVVWFQVASPALKSYQKYSKQIDSIKPQVATLRTKLKANQQKLIAKKEKEAPKSKLPEKKLFHVAKLTEAQDKTSIILDEIFYIAKKNNIGLLEIDHSLNDFNKVGSSSSSSYGAADPSSKIKETLNKLTSQAEKISTDMNQKEIEYYTIRFLFSSNYNQMQSFLTELLQTKYYIQIDSVESAIQKGRREIINTNLQISILLKRK